ncbi:MAG: S8 family serine peptidase [Flavobacteriales bacterium]|nr:S8 family serine peptidase [Flavobacteriales bacterium]
MNLFKTVTLTLFLVSCGMSVFAQQNEHQRYWVQFDHKSSSTYSVDRPHEFLSERAIARRQRQGIPITENDLPVSPAYVQELSAAGLTVVHRSRWFNAVTVEVPDEQSLARMMTLPFVTSVQPVHRYARQADEVIGEVTDMSLSKTSGMVSSDAAYDYGLSYHQSYMLGGDYMHSKGYKGQGMMIAVLDAGFWEVGNRIVFDSLRTKGHLLGTRDFVDGGSSVYEDHTHGMQVLSVMAGNLPGNIVGTAPEADYWLLRSENSQSEMVMEEDNWVVAAEFADSVGADIIHSSLGYSTFDDVSEDHTYQDMDGRTTKVTLGAEAAASKGMLVVNSAGNKGASSWKYIAAPADGKNVLAVGAVDQYKMPAYFSSLGPTVDGRLKPNVVAQGLSTIIASVAPDTSPGPRIQTGSGTSFSAPLISGLAACLWQAHPLATAGQVMDAIEQSGDQFFAPDTVKGYGVPNFAVASLILDGILREDFEDDHLVMAYPNPFRDELSFVFFSAVNQTVSVELINAMGQVIYHRNKRFVSNTFNVVKVEELPPLTPQGVYILTISTPIETYPIRVFRSGH